MLKEHHKHSSPPRSLQNLMVEMLKQQVKPPKLRAKGAETRGVVGFAAECAQKMHANSPTVRNTTVLKCVSALLDFFVTLNLPSWRPDLAKNACYNVCNMYKALSDESIGKGHDEFWRMKPKLHLFQELVEYQAQDLGNPRFYWNYVDEDFVGRVAKLAMPRGGPKQATTTCRLVLTKY